MDKFTRYWDRQSRYCYPGTSVLINLANIKEPHQLALFEVKVTGVRIAELYERPIYGQFDLEHLKQIHRYIFQDVYPFAGKIREENITKGFFTFAQAPYIEPCAQHLFMELAREKYLTRYPVEEFAKRAAYYLAEINVLHPFPEGNGRAYREFIRCLALHAGYELDWSRVDRQKVLNASIQSVTDSTDLAHVVCDSIVNRQPNPDLKAFYIISGRSG
ncbi:Fic/DOC family protein [Thermoflavimicrobium dichotomicum]|uniref:protein adenylyltransferase n=1 Tax=Thermoflavimicrobium dichotomicum TaxID=46223 RepID=A0A1I3RZ28_9BACL|nr:Fic family protein [Thermoflavimicrobium dichotomicum]SFJ51894.1 cell filamentation protein [Thermoflavimicrobium dichotomicum]